MLASEFGTESRGREPRDARGWGGYTVGRGHLESHRGPGETL